MRIKVTRFLEKIASAAVAADVVALQRERAILKDIDRYTATWNGYPELFILLADAIVCVLEDVESFQSHTYDDGVKKEVSIGIDEHFERAARELLQPRWEERVKISEDHRLRVRMEFDVVVTLADAVALTAAKNAVGLAALEISLRNVQTGTAGDMNEDPRKFIKLVQALQSMLVTKSKTAGKAPQDDPNAPAEATD